ncbi:MAG: cryptochrome/photolyase family protein [Opitutales bacterium]|jgi:deoxyribodipyrimidine photolyase-related protein|nr:cryptochrome/photolyase family protein [Opitutales bacterium]MDP4776639.1 cryptochrome/photolyase family protein [Opitutales bacterium]MDP4882800.1 cryptochrome/photolyase family protein [Opitutales bacterium]
MKSPRHLILVFGDQLNRDASAFDGFDPEQDAVWMAEVDYESKHVWSHKQRIALFLAAMRHFRNSLRAESIRVEYAQLDDQKDTDKFSTRLGIDLRALRPDKVIVTRPGEWRVLEGLKKVCREEGVPLELREDRHFFTTPDDFAEHAKGRKGLRMEFFYRELRKRFDVLMEDGKPTGGDWNYDKENRGNFGKSGPEDLNNGPGFKPDAVTREVLELVAERFPDHPGSLDSFAWAVSPKDAQKALQDFIQHRLPKFGDYQDAMWIGEPWLYHSLISTSLNLKLLDPRDAVVAAEEAYRNGDAPLAAVEGFIRQILGWREYVRGIYWAHMPEYLERNAMGAKEPLPEFYWTGETDLVCLQQAIGQTLEHGYAHHIQRLMVTGLYALLLGVDPKQLHEWYLAVYVDAVEWVELPNTLGMSQYGDGGLMASKPYVATGSYINKMSNYCKSCPKNPKEKTGENACPFTTLYWDYLIRNQDALKSNNRMGLQLRNLDRLNNGDRSAIAKAANQIRKSPGACYQSKL